MLKTKDDIKQWLDSAEISNYTINDDLTVDVDGYVSLTRMNLVKIPVQFGVVSGYFSCMRNELTSLKGCPRTVTGDFNCSYNKLTSLDGCPEKVIGDFICSINLIKDLKNFKTHISGTFIHFTRHEESGILELQNLYKPELKEHSSVRIRGTVLKNILDKNELAKNLLIELPSNQSSIKNKLKV